MMIVDTTNVIDNSIFLKAKLDKTMVGSNYYLENLQDFKENYPLILFTILKHGNFTVKEILLCSISFG